MALGLGWTGEVKLALTEIRSPDRSACSELLYRLSYPGPIMICITHQISCGRSRRIRRAVHVARMEDRRGAYRVWWRDVKERDRWEDLGVDGRKTKTDLQ